MKDASILGNLRGMLVDEIHGLRLIYNNDYAILVGQNWLNLNPFIIYFNKISSTIQ